MDKIKQYIANRLSERTTHAGLAALAVAGLSLFFPEYALVIQMVAGAAGIGMATLPTGGQAK